MKYEVLMRSIYNGFDEVQKIKVHDATGRTLSLILGIDGCVSLLFP